MVIENWAPDSGVIWRVWIVVVYGIRASMDESLCGLVPLEDKSRQYDVHGLVMGGWVLNNLS